ncbi:MAG: hypothetical protein ACR2F0_08450, partial [Chthoniobacterales bacterium]
LSRLRLVECLLATGVLILPWYIRLPESLAGWRVTMNWLKGKPAGFNRLAAVRELALQFFRATGPRSMKIALWIFGSVGVLLLWRMRRRPFAWRRLLLWLAFAAACMGPLAFDLIQHTYTVAARRYAMAALPPAYLLAGLGFATLRLPLRSILLALVLIAWKPELLSMYRDRTPWTAIRKVARAASEGSGPSDLILVHSIPSGALGVARYATGSAAIAPWVGQLGKRRVPESIEQLARGRKRILFVSVHEVGAEAPEEQWLRVHAIVARGV